ncbi:hypothetical protein IWT140_01828 [Secundilactobacillus pentosiphilus]|uniref:Zinc-ribbon domain-containing protein n=1 Tax=Secundilactobacillus pentosiphilus TaxID=1714682 RepID=A0A1Z5IR32_9LACO|nr:hypothetical protein IWT140_01828 [Secundilactobacillus pentosiphilus]
METKAKFCPKCGAPVSPDDMYCGNCGTKLIKDKDSGTPENKVAASQTEVMAEQHNDNTRKAVRTKMVHQKKSPWFIGAVGLIVVLLVIMVILQMPRWYNGTFTYHARGTVLGSDAKDTETFVVKNKTYTYHRTYSYQNGLGDYKSEHSHDKGTVNVKGKQITFTNKKGDKIRGKFSQNKKVIVINHGSFKKDRQ